MLAYPQVDHSLDQLHRNGWAMGDVCVNHPNGRMWVVTGHRGKHWIIAKAPGQAAAWWLAWQQAEVLKKDRKKKS
jgi:hypothetical protein